MLATLGAVATTACLWRHGSERTLDDGHDHELQQPGIRTHRNLVRYRHVTIKHLAGYIIVAQLHMLCIASCMADITSDFFTCPINGQLYAYYIRILVSTQLIYKYSVLLKALLID